MKYIVLTQLKIPQENLSRFNLYDNLTKVFTIRTERNIFKGFHGGNK